MSQLRSNYADDNIRKIIASTDPVKSKIPRKIAALCVAGLAAGLLSGHIGSFIKTNIIDKDQPIVTRTAVSEQNGKQDAAFDIETRAAIDKVNKSLNAANAALDANPAVLKVFQKEGTLAALPEQQREIYNEVNSLILRSKVHLNNIRSDIQDKAANTVIEGETRFILADDIAERLENTESKYETTVQRAMLQQDHSLNF